MHRTRRSFIQASSLGMAALLPAGRAGAQVGAPAALLDQATIIIGFAAGSTVDLVARTVADRLRGRYANTVMVENRVGAGGQLALTAVKAGRTDGSAILMTPMAMMSVYPFTYKTLPYDPVADFTPITRGVMYDRAFAVGAAVPASVRTVPEFGAWAKQNPNGASFASSAAGSPLHFTGVLIGRALGVEMLHVPYRSSAAVPDLMTGRLPSIVAPLGDVYKDHMEGNLRVLATTGPRRTPFTPAVPTLEEQGLHGIGIPEGYHFYLPARAPATIGAQLNAAMRQVLGLADVARVFATMCMEPAFSTPETLRAELETSMRYWGPTVRSIGFTVDS